LFDFVVWAAIRKRRVFLRFVEGVFDLVMTLAPQIGDDTWVVAPFAAQIAAACWDRGGKHCRLSDFTHTQHFMVVTATPAMACAGNSIVAQCLREGWAALDTAADGDCGIDALCIIGGGCRGIIHRMILRAQMGAFMASVACEPDSIWQCCEDRCGETSHVSSVSTRPAPASAGSSGTLLAATAASNQHGCPVPAVAGPSPTAFAHANPSMPQLSLANECSAPASAVNPASEDAAAVAGPVLADDLVVATLKVSEPSTHAHGDREKLMVAV
jgi:hypothetical protein